MRNIEVIKQFLNKSSGNSYNGNLISNGVKLINYNTCIAEWTDSLLLVNVTKYSNSTSRIQNMLIHELKSRYALLAIENVPINTKYLWNPEKM